jgi:HTH-type transcriptional regulator, transcriptional repressor of NAD biosynthesis genes
MLFSWYWPVTAVINGQKSSSMIKAFVFGKFMPFHKGHEGMIRFALTHCDRLTILVCCSDQETLSADLRTQWIQEIYANEPRVDVVNYPYEEAVLPNSSVASTSISGIWAKVFSELLPDHSLLITSEPYGVMVADYMGIRHTLFDRERLQFPVSASKIRTAPGQYWQYLPHRVKEDLSTKVVILGTESTGKTTLTGMLAKHFNCGAVLEAGRDLVEDSNDFSMQDLYHIASEHASRIAIATKDHAMLIIDTDIHITISYGQFAFGEEPVIDPAIFRRNKAALYLYLDNDVPYEQDGTRLSEEARNLLDSSHRNTLAKYGVKYTLIRGNWEERFRQAVKAIESIGDLF